MKTCLLVIVAAVLIWLGGCIPSVSPYYTAQDLVFEDQLLGEWQEDEPKEDPELWKFERAEGDPKSYLLTVTEEKGKEAQFQAHLFQLKDEKFLDIRVADVRFAKDQADLAAFTLVPGHLVLHVGEIGPELKIAFFDFDWLEKQLEQHPDALAHHKEEDILVLTASSKALQKFVMTHLKAGLFDEHGTLVRSPRNAKTAALN